MVMSAEKIAIILPCYNEYEILPSSCARITGLLKEFVKEGIVSEESIVCFVDDGSTDDTWRLIKEAAVKDKSVTGISLSRNFGQESALLAALHEVEADIYVTIDVDFQDPPEVIREMILKYRSGCGIVYGVRRKRDTDSFFKKYSALFFYNLMTWLGTGTLKNHSEFRLMGRKAVDAFRKYPERDMFLRGIVCGLGFKTGVVYYDRTARTAGTTKYSCSKMIKLALKAIFSFSVLPLRMISFAGIVFLFTGIVILMSGHVITDPFLSSRLFLGVSALSLGINLLALGIISEYIGRIMIESKRRPRFIIGETVGVVSGRRNAIEYGRKAA